MKRILQSVLLSFAPLAIAAQTPTDTTATELDDVTVHAARMLNMKSMGVENKEIIGKTELFRAACCNLGESFTTNPSVDVNYSDAATGAKQIKLLGLSGTYVQMMTENIPNFRGAAGPFALGYVPGTWMQSIQVSKGASSVKNGYESITGQINIEYVKPQLTDHLSVNMYANSKAKLEANADASIHLNDKWSTGLLLHYEDQYANHDENKDGFQDLPRVRQYHGMWRWGYFSDSFISQFGVNGLKEYRKSGQMDMDHSALHSPYKINIETDRYEAFAKNAFVLDREHNTNIALILSGSIHKADAAYGNKLYNLNQKNLYASLIFENDFSDMHKLSAGLSFNRDSYDDCFNYSGSSYGLGSPLLSDPLRGESVTGAYAQYTFLLDETLTVMAGLRGDVSSEYGGFVTPRAHVKYKPCDWFSLRASAGKGYRSVHVMPENHFLLASSRQMDIAPDLKQEDALNCGASAAFDIPIAGKRLKLNAEYYYTDFKNQVVVDMDSNPHAVSFYNLEDKSYSHVLQVDATYQLFEGFSMTAAYRWMDAKTTYGGVLMERPLTSRYKGLVSANYETPLGFWKFDVTLQINGGGRMPTPYLDGAGSGTTSWDARYKAFPQLQAQVTREFRYFSVYLGGENLTGFKQKMPIIEASNPWGYNFDATMVWGPVHGPMVYAGFRFNIEKY